MKEFIKKINDINKKIGENKLISTIVFFIKSILYVFLVMILIVILVQKVTNNNFAIGGIRIFSVISESMVPEYKIGDILVSSDTPASELKIGDNVTYYGEEGDMANLIVTHKIINIRQEDGKYYFITKGTANPVADPEIDEDQIYGKVIYKTVFLSLIGQVMSNIISYYVLFTIVGLMISYQVVRIIFDKDEDEDDLSGEEN